MSKSFLLKISFLILLAVVLVAAVAVIRSGFSGTDVKAVQSQTFFEQFVMAGGPIVWFVLLPMSLITFYLAAKFCLTIRRKKLLPDDIGNRIIAMIGQSNPGQLEAQIADGTDFVSVAVLKALSQGRGDWFRMRNALAESLQEQAGGLLRRIEWLSLIGNVSPMVGLFGTVFGMIKLFNAIVMAGGQPQPAQLADGISVALVTTFWGLFIAIPALTIYGVFRNRIETLAGDAVAEAENIVPVIRRSLKKQPEQLKSKQAVKKTEIRELGGRQTRTIGQSVPLR